MKRLLALLPILFCVANVQAQNIEGQIIASQYGKWKVPGYASNAYSSFAPTSCRVQGGASFFFAFAVGTPTTIVDGSPSLTETVTPTSTIDTNVTCAVSIAPVNSHQLPFYLTSATGGLQEALNQNLTNPQTNTIILDNTFYQLVGGATNAAAVIAAAKGSTNLGLVDVTQVPTVWYRWNGSQYVAISPSTSGGSTLVNDLFSNGPSNAWEDLYDFVATGPTVYNPQTAVNAAAANNGSVILQNGVGRTPFTNTAPTVYGVKVNDNRIDISAQERSVTEWGAQCDVYGASSGITIAQGSTTYAWAGQTSANVGKTLIFVGTVSGVPTAYEPVITAINDNGTGGTLDTAAPFAVTNSTPYLFGHDDTAAIAAAFQAEVGSINGISGQAINFPAGQCLSHTIELVGQPFNGLNGTRSAIVPFPGEDTFAAADPSQGAAPNQNDLLHIHDLNVMVAGDIDATLPWSKVAQGTTTAMPAMYRPTGTSTTWANNPLGPGWILGATNGVAAITASSAVICVPSSETAPAVGSYIEFPYLSIGLYASTVASTAGSCSGGATARTLTTALPGNVTSAQQEWFSGSGLQNIQTMIPATGRTFPMTITLAASIAPWSGSESNVAPYGLVEIQGEQFTYFGYSKTAPYTITLQAGAQNGTSAAAHSVNAPIFPLNPFKPQYPWPVIPSINSNDTTPTMASYYPAWNVGNCAFAFPLANGSATEGTGAWNASTIEHMYLTQFSLTGLQGQNHNCGMYFVQLPYGDIFRDIQIESTYYGLEEGAPSIENNYWSTFFPTADGTSWDGVQIHAGYIMDMAAGSKNSYKDFNTYADVGTSGFTGAGAGMVIAPVLSDQTGSQIMAQSLTQFENLYLEPEDGSADGAQPLMEWDCHQCTYVDLGMGGGGETYLGGDHQHWIGGTFNNSSSAPVINYGAGNTADYVELLGQEPISNTYGAGALINYAPGAKFNGLSDQAFSNPGGPYGNLVLGNAREPYASQTNETFNTGNLTQPYTSSGSGFITPEEFDNDTAFDAAPMSVGWTFDDTSPITHAYTACNVGTSAGNTYCNSYRWNNGEIPIGPGQRIVPGKYTMYLSMKDVATASNTQTVTVYSNCGGVSNTYAVPITNAWPTTAAGVFSTLIDFTAVIGSGCYLGVQFKNATTADTIQVGYLDFAPLAENLNAQTINATTINLPAGSFGGTPTGCAQSPVTGIDGGYTCPTKGWESILSANQGASDTTVSMASTTGLSPSGCFYVDAEYECYTGISGSTLTGLVRGVYTTTATTHNSGALTISVDLVLGSIQQPPVDVVAGGSSTPPVFGINNGFPSLHNGLGVLDINSGSNETWFDTAGHITQSNQSGSGANFFGDPVQVGEGALFAPYPVISSTGLLVQTNGPNETYSPLGFGGGVAGSLNVIQTPTIGAPSVANFAGTGSTTRSYVCTATDYDGNTINGTTTTLTNTPNGAFSGSSPYIQITCPWSAGVASFQIWRTAGGPNQGLLASVSGVEGAETDDFNGSATTGTPPASNSSNPHLSVAGSGNPTITLGSSAGSPQIVAGAGAPTGCGSTYGNGSLYVNTSGSAGATDLLYVCDSATTTWVDVK